MAQKLLGVDAAREVAPNEVVRAAYQHHLQIVNRMAAEQARLQGALQAAAERQAATQNDLQSTRGESDALLAAVSAAQQQLRRSRQALAALLNPDSAGVQGAQDNAVSDAAQPGGDALLAQCAAVQCELDGAAKRLFERLEQEELRKQKSTTVLQELQEALQSLRDSQAVLHRDKKALAEQLAAERRQILQVLH